MLTRLNTATYSFQYNAWNMFFESGIRGRGELNFYDFVKIYGNAYFDESTAKIVQMRLDDMPFDIQQKCYDLAIEQGNYDSEGIVGFKKMFDNGYFSPVDYSCVEC